MNSRRGFFGSMLRMGVGGAAVAAVPATVYVATKELPATKASPKEDISHLAPPEGAHTLQIMGAYGEPKKQEQLFTEDGTRLNSYYIMGNQVHTHSVSMTVGRDNRLWMKVGDEWRRVALEA